MFGDVTITSYASLWKVGGAVDKKVQQADSITRHLAVGHFRDSLNARQQLRGGDGPRGGDGGHQHMLDEMWHCLERLGDNVPGILDMVGQENNSSQFGFLYMVGQGSSREKAFVPGPETMMILYHQKSNNRKSNRLIVFKLIPGELPAHDASFCICKHFHCDFVNSATVTSLPTVRQPAVLLPRGVHGNKNVFRISEYPVYYTLKHVPEMSANASRFHFERYVSLQD